MSDKPQMTVIEALQVCVPFGSCQGWQLQSVAEKRPLTFCQLLTRRRRFYGDLRTALDVLYNGALHKAAKRVKATAAKADADARLLEQARY